MSLPAFVVSTAAFLSLAAALAAAGAPAPSVVPSDRGTVGIGLIVPASGPLAEIGSDVDGGFKYYLATHGDRLGGFRVNLNEGDEGASSEIALASAKTLVETQKSDVVVGLVNSDIAYDLAAYLWQQKKAAIVAVAGADGLTQGRGDPYLFRVTNTNSQPTMPLGDYVCSAMKKKTAAIVAVDYSFGYEAAGGFARVYTGEGCRIAQVLYVPQNTVDFAPFVAKIDRSASVVFAAFSGVDAPRFLQAIREAGITQPIVGHGALTDELLLASERAAALGVITALPYAATQPTALNTQFRLGYEGLTHRPVSRYVEDGYVSAEALDLALAKIPAGSVRSDALIAALREVSFAAPRGPFRFDDRRAAIVDIHIRRVREFGGRLRNVVLTTYPAVSQFWRYDPARYLSLKSYLELKNSWVRSVVSSPATPATTPSPAPAASH